MLGERLTNLLRLLSQDEFKAADTLAANMNLSSKTIRKLIRELNESLENNGAHIKSRRGEGFMLEVTNLNAFQSLFLSKSQNIPSDSAERVNYVIEQFLKNNEYVKMEEMCDTVFVSRKTLAYDIKKAEKFFEEFHLKIERKPYYGMRLTGDEFQKRHCLARYLQIKNSKTAEYEVMIHSDERRIADCLLEILENEEYHISDVGLHSLILHICISIQRIRAKQYVSIKKEDYLQFICEKDYLLAQKCMAEIGKRLNVKFPEEEIQYLSIHFAGKKYHQNLVISSDIQDAVNEMINEIFVVFQINLQQDLELVMSLGRHLVPLIIRMKYGMRLTNPLLMEVKKRYSLAYVMAVQACVVLERRYHSILDSDEVSYIALLLALSLERHRKQIKKKKVLFVCASGAGTARLMAYKMQEIFWDYIGEIIICDQLNIKKQDFTKIDYIFTTVPIRDTVPVPICEVKGLLEGDETSYIRHFLRYDQERDILAYYPEELFFPDIQAQTKEDALQEIIQRIRTARKLPPGFYKAVLKRETLARTCMGNHVAMPHPCTVMTDDTFVSVSILKHPIQWDESQSVQAVFLVSVSKNKHKKIQNFYATTAKLLLDPNSIKTLIEQKTYHTLTKLLKTAEKERSDLDG